MPLKEYYSYNDNMACHDLTSTRKGPPTATRLLGLGAGFSLQCNHIKETDATKSLARFHEDIRTKTFVKCVHGANPDKECPKLYMKNLDWISPRS